jgi:hypothetical protein
MHDRRRVHYGRRSPASVGEATAGVLPGVAPFPAEFDARSPSRLVSRVAVLEPQADDLYASHDLPDIPEQQRWDDDEAYRPGHIAREKEHPAKPMTVDQALYEMELVGHDFYLFADADSGQPSVVYRRKGFDYGVIRLA